MEIGYLTESTIVTIYFITSSNVQNYLLTYLLTMCAIEYLYLQRQWLQQLFTENSISRSLAYKQFGCIVHCLIAERASLTVCLYETALLHEDHFD